MPIIDGDLDAEEAVQDLGDKLHEGIGLESEGPLELFVAVNLRLQSLKLRPQCICFFRESALGRESELGDPLWQLRGSAPLILDYSVDRGRNDLAHLRTCLRRCAWQEKD